MNVSLGGTVAEDLGETGSPQTNKVRQGVTGQGVRYVLVISLVAVVVGMVLVYVTVGLAGR